MKEKDLEASCFTYLRPVFKIGPFQCPEMQLVTEILVYVRPTKKRVLLSDQSKAVGEFKTHE